MNQPTYRILLLIVIGALIAIAVPGCGHRVILIDDTELAANLTQPCPPLNKLAAGDGKTITRWAAGTVNMYEDCRDRHSALVEVFKPKE